MSFRVLPCLANLWCAVEAAAAASLEAAAAALFGRVGSRHAVLLLRENQSGIVCTTNNFCRTWLILGQDVLMI